MNKKISDVRKSIIKRNKRRDLSSSKTQQPQLAVSRLIETPGGARFRAWAVAERLLPLGFDGPPLSRAQMLLLPDGNGNGQPTIPVGPACRICPRGACPARHEPSILGPA